MSAILDHPLNTYTRERIESRINDRDIAEQLLPLLMNPEVHSKSELLHNAWSFISPLLALKKKELDYVNLVCKGELRLKLLFEDHPETAEFIARHPALLWKMVNVHKLLKGTK